MTLIITNGVHFWLCVALTLVCQIDQNGLHGLSCENTINIAFSVTYYLELQMLYLFTFTFHILLTNFKLVVWTLKNINKLYLVKTITSIV